MQDGTLIIHFKEFSGTILFGVGLTLIWSFFWPGWIRDDEGQALPRSSLARATFALSMGLLYLALVSAAFLAPAFFAGLQLPSLQFLVELVEQTSGGDTGLKGLLKHAPFGVLILMGVLYNIPQVKEMFERWAYFLHASQYSKGDERLLQEHFQRCDFDISDAEVGLNQDYIEQFDVYVIDNDSQLIKDRTLDIWRKASALLRFVRKDLDGESPILGKRERAEVEALEEAHRRKTQLAMNIIRVLDQMERTSEEGRRVARIASALSDAPHRDRDAVIQAEELAQHIAAAEAQAAQDGFQRPVRLSSRQLGEYISQIGSYFFKEYQIILRDAARLASRAIVRAGDEAPARLDTARYSGFEGLGQIERASFDTVLWTLMMTWATVVMSFVAASFAMGREMQLSLIVSIAMTVAIATTIGSMWASRRVLVERRTTPWSSYLAAGFAAVAMFCVVHAIRFSWNPAAAVERIAERTPSAESWTLPVFLFQILPFSIGLVFLVAGICRLVRVPSWSWTGGSALKERLTDGLFLAAIYAIGSIAAFMTHIALGTAFGERLEKALADGSLRFLVMMAMNGTVGFVVGAAIVRDVRRIAHSHVLARPAGMDQGAAARPDPVPLPESLPSKSLTGLPAE